MDEKYNLSATPRLITDEQKKQAAHKSQQNLHQTEPGTLVAKEILNGK